MNGWDPYSESVRNIPYFYWLVAFRTHRYKLYETWSSNIKPHGEFISSLIAPENYGEWKKAERQKERNKKEGLPDQVKVGDSTIATADTYIDAEKGLVNINTGEVLVSKEELQKRMGIEGIAYSL